MGVYPLPFTEVMHASVDELLRHVALRRSYDMTSMVFIRHLPALPEVAAAGRRLRG